MQASQCARRVGSSNAWSGGRNGEGLPFDVVSFIAAISACEKWAVAVRCATAGQRRLFHDDHRF
eukprot:9111152-Karenia_brevis.AAC.1